jgi:hypothetical protein
MSVRSRLSSFRSILTLGFDIHDVEGIVIGGLFGALQVGFIMGFYRTEMTYEIGGIVGLYSLTGGWWVTMVLGVLFGIPFVAFVSGSINSFANSVIMLSSRSSILQKMLVPLLQRSALGITCGGVGILYGIGVGIVFQVIALPIWLEFFIGISVPGPVLYLTIGGLFGVVAWTLYGGAMGLIYGLILENSTG